MQKPMQKPVAATTNPSARRAGPRLPIDEPRRGPGCSASHRHRCRRPRQHVPGRTKVHLELPRVPTDLLRRAPAQLDIGPDRLVVGLLG
jgi:hypothetical protein